MMDEGLITPTQLAEMALGFMSEDDVKEMAIANELLEEPEDEEEPEFVDTAEIADETADATADVTSAITSCAAILQSVFFYTEDRMSADTSKIIIAISTSILVAAIAMIFISMDFSSWMYSALVPLLAYGISIGMSSIYQYSTCNNVLIKSISISNLFILGTTSLTTIVLFLESLPILKNIFGPYAPRNPITGLPYNEGSDEYVAAMASEKHYKLQFFSSIVTAVIPVYVSDTMKNGFVYFYWLFWMTLLPLYFLLSVQGLCA
jgi:hypothetical protein